MLLKLYGILQILGWEQLHLDIIFQKEIMALQQLMVGLIYDGIATALPFLPAGASAVIKVERATETTKKTLLKQKTFLMELNTHRK